MVTLPIKQRIDLEWGLCVIIKTRISSCDKGSKREKEKEFLVGHGIVYCKWEKTISFLVNKLSLSTNFQQKLYPIFWLKRIFGKEIS